MAVGHRAQVGGGWPFCRTGRALAAAATLVPGAMVAALGLEDILVTGYLRELLPGVQVHLLPTRWSR